MDYWALYSQSQVLSEEPLVVYSVIRKVLHREIGPKGCYLISVSLNGHCEPCFIETSGIRFKKSNDIAGMKTEAEFLEILRHKRRISVKQHKKNILLSIVLVGTGPLHRLFQEGVRKLWLQKSPKAKRKSKSIFGMPYRMMCNTRPSINLAERRLLSDVVGDYLRAYDDMVDGNTVQMVRQNLAERPEFKRRCICRFGEVMVLLRALKPSIQ